MIKKNTFKDIATASKQLFIEKNSIIKLNTGVINR